MSELQTWEQSSFKTNIERSTYVFFNSVVKELSALTDDSERKISDRIIDVLVKDLQAGWNESKKSELMTRLGYNN